MNIQTKRDLAAWAASHLDISDNQADRVARAIWVRPDFPHPLTAHSDLSDYLADLDGDWLYVTAYGTAEQAERR